MDTGKQPSIGAMNNWLVVLIASSWLALTSFGHADDPPREAVPSSQEGMVLVPPGEYILGEGDPRRGEESENFGREAKVAGFYIDKLLVTNREFVEFVHKHTEYVLRYSNEPNLNKPEFPAVGVNWLAAKAYCEDKGKRLPTEWEWEVAARSGDNRRYPWGDEEPSARGIWRANIGPENPTAQDPARYADDGFQFTSPVGAFPAGATPSGLMDMAGNVWQWTSTPFVWVAYRKFASEEAASPPELEDSIYKTVRGGAWTSSPWSVRSTARRPLAQGSRDIDVGFRCAKDAT